MEENTMKIFRKFKPGVYYNAKGVKLNFEFVSRNNDELTFKIYEKGSIAYIYQIGKRKLGANDNMGYEETSLTYKDKLYNITAEKFKEKAK